MRVGRSGLGGMKCGYSCCQIVSLRFLVSGLWVRRYHILSDAIKAFPSKKDPELRGKGTVCARKWPRSPGHDRAPAVEAKWPAFAYAAGHWKDLTKEIQDAYCAM
ncbi:unnamed protein product, partial [marine sediment metagenome]